METQHRNNLRRSVLADRDGLVPAELEEKSSVIAARLATMPEVASATAVLVYMHFRSEVRTLEVIRWMLAEGKTVAIPLTRPKISRIEAVRIDDPEKEATPGYFGIPEPLPHLVQTQTLNPYDLDLVLVPGSAFDVQGGRLGYGGGYYDRFFSSEATRAVRIGLAFDLQLVEKVPIESHDQLMDFVVTERNTYDCRRNRYAYDSCLSR